MSASSWRGHGLSTELLDNWGQLSYICHFSPESRAAVAAASPDGSPDSWVT